MKQPDGVGIELEEAACPRCGAAERKPVYAGEDYLYGVPGVFRVVECCSCSLWYQNPRPSKRSLGNLYPPAYTPHAPAAPAAAPPPAGVRRFLRGARRRLSPVAQLAHRRARAADLVPTLVPGGAVLEIGCASGGRLLELQRRGWRDIRGIELMAPAAEHARALGFRIDCAMVEDALQAIPDASLDAVVSSMVLEHLYDPFAVIAQVAAKLKPGGEFLFSTVVRDALDARLFGGFWAGFDFPRHMVHLSRDDLCLALQPHFGAVRFVHQAAPVDFVRSASWRIDRGHGGVLDRLFLAAGQGGAAQLFSLLLAYAGLTTRVSVYCRRNHERTAS